MGYASLEYDPRPAITSGVAIFLTVLACSFLGDGLRDALDPRFRV